MPKHEFAAQHVRYLSYLIIDLRPFLFQTGGREEEVRLKQQPTPRTKWQNHIYPCSRDTRSPRSKTIRFVWLCNRRRKLLSFFGSIAAAAPLPASILPQRKNASRQASFIFENKSENQGKNLSTRDGTRVVDTEKHYWSGRVEGCFSWCC